jgi:hypothetical protein
MLTPARCTDWRIMFDADTCVATLSTRVHQHTRVDRCEHTNYAAHFKA